MQLFTYGIRLNIYILKLYARYPHKLKIFFINTISDIFFNIHKLLINIEIPQTVCRANMQDIFQINCKSITPNSPFYRKNDRSKFPPLLSNNSFIYTFSRFVFFFQIQKNGQC